MANRSPGIHYWVLKYGLKVVTVCRFVSPNLPGGVQDQTRGNCFVSVAEASEVKEHLYEGMFLVDSNAFASDPEAVTAELMKVLEKAGAQVVAHRPWQDGKLAYEIQGRRKGLHYIVCFKMITSGMEILTRQCQLSDTILRQMVVTHTEELFNAVVDAISGNPAEEVSAEQTAAAPAKAAPVAAESGA